VHREKVRQAAVRDGARADRAKVVQGRAEVGRAVPLRRVPKAVACARGAAIVNRMSVECRARRRSVRSAEPS